MNPNLKKLIKLRLDEELSETFLQLFAGEIWVLEESRQSWCLKVNSQGELDFNGIFFESTVLLFGGNLRNFQIALKEWFEQITDIYVRKVHRVNSNFEFYMDTVYDTPLTWDIKERSGFAYTPIKKYLDLSERYKCEKLKIEYLLNEKLQRKTFSASTSS